MGLLLLRRDARPAHSFVGILDRHRGVNPCQAAEAHNRLANWQSGLPARKIAPKMVADPHPTVGPGLSPIRSPQDDTVDTVPPQDGPAANFAGPQVAILQNGDGIPLSNISVTHLVTKCINVLSCGLAHRRRAIRLNFSFLVIA